MIQDIRSKGGRTLGTSKKRKREHSITLITAKNQITIEYKNEMGKSSSKRMKKGRLTEIIRKVMKRTNNLPESLVVLESTICKQLTWGDNISNSVGRYASITLDLDPIFVSINVHMARIRQSLISYQVLNLINGMINMDPVRHKFTTFKEKHSTGDIDHGRVGPGY